jgi:hypothetical protein
MKFLLEVDLSAMTAEGEAAKELGRILRYWAGGVGQLKLRPGQGSDIYDSAYRPLGRWIIETKVDAAP